MPSTTSVMRPKDDAEYLERMTKCIFTAGLNWNVVDKKWPNFQKAFFGFAPIKVANLSGADIRELMSDQGIVRNERKISAAVNNASEFLRLQEKFGSFQRYIASFGKDEKRLQNDIQDRFQQLGASTARMFLWSVGYELTPNAEEKKWMAEHQ